MAQTAACRNCVARRTGDRRTSAVAAALVVPFAPTKGDPLRFTSVNADDHAAFDDEPPSTIRNEGS